jgi:hypothetical protein
LKDIRKVNVLKDHLAPKKRKRRKDCPNYIDVVRSYGHATFRPDTFAKSKKMIKNEDGSFEFLLPHIQNMSIQLHISEPYYEWQQLNRWVYTSSDGEEIEVLPSICLRLFYYALCPCCKDPKQRDCADSMFAHALVGMGKIRMSEVNDKKNQIQQCTCPFDLREQNKDMWRSTKDFMTTVLCSPINFEEFQNPEISQNSHKVQEEMACAIKKERVDMNQRHLSFTNTRKLPRVRAKGTKSEVAIKPGRQDGKLVIFKRSCAYGECHDCGVEKYFTSHKRPLEWDEEFQVNIKEYQDLARNNSDKKQKELVSVTVTAKEVMQKIADKAGNVRKHLWQSRWGSHMRRYDYNTFIAGMVRYKADFSATLDINPQDKLNCAISAHAKQNVMIFSLNPNIRTIVNKAGLPFDKRFLLNIGFNFWGPSPLGAEPYRDEPGEGNL